MLGVTVAWLWQSGRIDALAGRIGHGLLQVTADAGFAVRAVYVEGRVSSTREELLTALRVDLGDPILAVDLARAQRALADLPWVAAASLERRLPGTLHIRLAERQPMALWQVNRRLVVIDGDGVVLADRDLGRFADLPIVVGENAPAQAPGLMAALARVPSVAAQVEAAVWMGDRRWDLKLASGIRVRLPELGFDQALLRLAEVATEDRLLDRNIVAIDLRLPDRLVVQTVALTVPPRKPGNRGT